MNLLIPHDLEEYRDKGCYLNRLALAYSHCGVNVTCGLGPFLNNEQHFDVVHVHWPEHFQWIARDKSPQACFDTYVSKLRDRVRRSICIWTVHNLFPHRHPSSQLHRWLYQSTIDTVHGLVHHCPRSIRLLRNCYRVSPTVADIVVPHGNYAHMVSGHTKEEDRRTLGLASDTKVFLFLGQLSSYKGPDLVLEAFKRLRAALPRSKCNLVGFGWTGRTSYLGEIAGIVLNWRWLAQGGWRFLVEYARGCRIFLGKKNEDNLAEFVAAADIIVLGHRNVHTSGLPIMAATFGKIAVAPDVRYLPYYVSSGGGVLYKAGSVTSLARAMRDALELNVETAEKTQTALAQKWDWQENSRKLVVWIEGLIRNRVSNRLPP